MAHLDLPSHPTYNDSNPLLDPSTASLGAEQDDGGQLDQGGATTARGSLADGRHAERMRGSSEDTILPPITTVRASVYLFGLSNILLRFAVERCSLS